MSDTTTHSRVKTVLKWALRVFYSLVILLLLVMSFALNFLVLPLEFILLLFFGWISYLQRVVPQVTFNAEIAFDAAVLLALAIFGLHCVLRWWRKQQPDSPGQWRVAWTLKITAMVLLLFATSIAATGLVHQTGWLLNEKYLVEDGSRSPLTRELSNLKQVALAIRMFAEDHDGKYPDNLDELFPNYLTWRMLLYTRPYHGEPPEPIIYYSGYNDHSPVDSIMLASPHPFGESSEARRVIVRVDSSGIVVKESEFQSLIQKQNSKAH